jgi:hypothetical protein
MPELYGQPFKWELREQIRELWGQKRGYRSQSMALHSLYKREVERREKAELELRELKRKLLELAGDNIEEQSQPRAVA